MPKASSIRLAVTIHTKCITRLAYNICLTVRYADRLLSGASEPAAICKRVVADQSADEQWLIVCTPSDVVCLASSSIG